MNQICKYIRPTLAVFLLTELLASCSSKPEQIEATAEDSHLIELSQAQFDQAGISTGKASKRLIGTELKVNGKIDVPPHGKISIHLPYGGFLKATEMLAGTKVRKGQLLAVVENPKFIEFQQGYLENLTNREYLKAEFERQGGLYEKKVISERDYQQAKGAFDANEVRIKTMGDRLKLIGFNLAKIKEGKTASSVNIYAPITGSILEVYGNVGRYVNPQDAIMDLTDITDLHVELSVFENDIPKVKEGQKIEFSVTSTPDLIRGAEIFLIGSGVQEDRSVTVHGHLDKMENDLLPGMYVSANIIIGSREVWTVPEEAVVRFDGKHYIYLLDGKRQEKDQTVFHFEMIEVIKGMTENGYAQIEYLANEGDISSNEIVLKGAFKILSQAMNNDDGGHGH